MLRKKAAATKNIGIDRDPAVLLAFAGQYGSSFQFVAVRAEDFLATYPFTGEEFVYLDPPYWPTSRRSTRAPYRFDYSESDHRALLSQIRTLPCAVMISGYRNSCYDHELHDWNRYTFSGHSRTGPREETVWLNYEPGILHDTTYLGRSFRDRQSIKRRRIRWVNRFRRESRPMQQSLLAEMTSIFAASSKVP